MEKGARRPWPDDFSSPGISHASSTIILSTSMCLLLYTVEQKTCTTALEVINLSPCLCQLHVVCPSRSPSRATSLRRTVRNCSHQSIITNYQS